uniref:Little elongation complex subunit 2 C-terminal domain-containing protein n=1 Tax=Anopheles atroparvus TaxID=41427 RepID=A0A182IZ23_ANOAO
MEQYKQLNWSKHNPRSEAKLLEQSAIDFALYQDDIFNLHINEIDQIHRIEDTFTNYSEHVEMPVDPRTGKAVQELELEPCKPLRLFGKFPSGSTLRADEHQHCLAMLNRINMRLPCTTPEVSKNYARYLSIMEKLAPERELFDNFVRNYFFTNLLGRVKNIEPELDELVVKVWQKKVEERIAFSLDLVGKYRLMTAVAFGGYAESGTNVSLEPADREVVETGNVRNLFSENLLRCVTLKRNQRVLDDFIDEWCSIQRGRVDEMTNVCSIVQQLPEVSAVIPAGTLTLLLNHSRNAQEQWTIPFRIKSFEGRRVLLLESKLPATKLSTHARKVKAHKLLAKSFMTFLKNGEPTERCKGSTAGQTEQNEASFEAVCIEEYIKRVQTRHHSLRKQLRDNRFYQPWKLKEGEEEHFLLIHSRQDCFESFRKERIFMNISVKLEYQPEFGAERMSQAELLQEWGRQLLRPNSKTLRLRVNAMTHTIISHHYLELRDIEEELARLYGIQPRNLIANVWNTLKLLQNFPVGIYLLQRDGKVPQGLSVYAQENGKSSTGGVLLDFCELVRTVEYECPPLEQYEWVPIDKFVITKLHRENTLLPCSFPHWKLVRRLESRECHKPKQTVRKPAPTSGPKKKGAQMATGSQTAKSKPPASKQPSAGKLMRKEKAKKRKLEIREQKALADKIRQSLDQYAPYEGPARHWTSKSIVTTPVTGDGSSGLHKGLSNGEGTATTTQPSLGTVHSAPFDYGSYAQQALIDPSENNEG